ncbi:MAG: DUF1553 domain-containing protein [Pirellulales bacterium]
MTRCIPAHWCDMWFNPSFRWCRCFWFAAIGVCLIESAAADESLVDFNREIRTILSNNCFKCHGPDKKERQSGLRLDQQQAAYGEAESGEIAIVPGKPDQSELIRRITLDDPEEAMPPADSGKKLSEREIKTLTEWVRQGGKYAKHWSYEKPVRPNPPTVKIQNWPRGEIDQFILARLEREGLKPQPAADRHGLIRRAALDLTGLPPALEEVEQFVNDKDPQAYENLVERLMEQETYGEHWARMWLDLARYADSAGYADDPPRVIWGYRDWVIQSINDNKPFDQFSIEQLAGDLLSEPTNDQLIATAFQRNTLTNNEGGTNDEEYRNVAIVDRVNTTMAVWMGTTIACAQCHNHKYDPISQEEYFQMFAIFNNTEDADRRDESPTLEAYSEQQKQQQKKLGVEITALEKQIAAKVASQQPAEKPPAAIGPLNTRFVRIELPGQKKFLSLAEVQVLVGQDNVARSGTATQINTAFEGPAKLAIDGNTDGDYHAAKSTTHTAEADNPWWEVDLGKSVVIDRIGIWNRTDGGVSPRLANFRIVLLDKKHQPLWLASVAKPPAPNVDLNPPQEAGKLSAADRNAVAGYESSKADENTPEKMRLEELKKQLASIKGVKTPIMRELPENRRRKTRIQRRGNFLDVDKEVTAGLPSTLFSPKEDEKINRLTLARWLVDENNPLTARVIVNRYWEVIFGVGLVRTSEEFGTQGELPSHPELLDWLATELIRLKWDTKAMVKLMVTSAAYRQSSRLTPKLFERDPDNRLLARGPRFRLSAEMIRDQALFVSGLLSKKMYGPPVKPPQPKLGVNAAFGGAIDWKTSDGEDRYRRGLYTTWRRSNPYPSMVTFDAPNREVCTIRRDRTNTPLQALVTLNDPVYVEAAQALGRRIAAAGDTTAEKAQFGFRNCLARPPADDELQEIVTLYEQVHDRLAENPDAANKIATMPIGPAPEGADVVELAAWSVVGNVLLNLDEMFMKR